MLDNRHESCDNADNESKTPPPTRGGRDNSPGGCNLGRRNKKQEDKKMTTTINASRDIISQAEKFRSVYFWRPEGSAGGRRDGTGPRGGRPSPV